MKNLIAVAMILTLTGLFASTVAGCECPREVDKNGNEIPRDDFAWASHVFSGEVISVTDLDSAIGRYSQTVVVRVDEIWKGKPGADKLITLYLTGGDCEPQLKLKEKYLVFAESSRVQRSPQPERSMLSPTFCGDTAPLKDSKQRREELRRRKGKNS